MKMLGGVALLVCLLSLAGPARAVAWQDAVDTLTRERGNAEACAAELKRYGGSAMISRGADVYDKAKVEFDAVINGLIVALAREEAPDSLADLEAAVKRGHAELVAFCARAAKLVPRHTGEKGPALVEVNVHLDFGKAFEALKELWFRHLDDDAMTRMTIETELEGAKWRDFAAVPPLP